MREAPFSISSSFLLFPVFAKNLQLRRKAGSGDKKRPHRACQGSKPVTLNRQSKANQTQGSTQARRSFFGLESRAALFARVASRTRPGNLSKLQSRHRTPYLADMGQSLLRVPLCWRGRKGKPPFVGVIWVCLKIEDPPKTKYHKNGTCPFGFF